jgi:hypothetical protein
VKILAKLVLLAGVGVCANAQTADNAEIRKLAVVQEKGGVKIEVDLTSPITPEVTVVNPEQLVLELPGAVSEQRAPIRVNQNGVQSVVVDNPAGSALTHVIVTLSEARQYDLAVQGSKVILTVLAAGETASRKRDEVPASAASVPLIGRLHRKKAPQDTATTASSPGAVAPPPVLPPIVMPKEQTGASVSPTTNAAGTAPEKNLSGEDAASAEQLPSTTTEASPGGAVASDAQSVAALQQANPDLRVAYRIKYVAEGVAYLEGGRNDGLSEGMKLNVKPIDPSSKPTAAKGEEVQVVAELEVASVALSSAVGEIHNPTRPVAVGDWAYLTSDEIQAVIVQHSLSATRKYPVVLAFSEGDTLDEEARVVIPRPPLPEINRARGRIGFDYSGVANHGAGGGLSSNAGLMLRTDITRINGTYWNLTGFWRGRLSNRSTSTQTTIQDLINRTYTIGLTYDNPNSKWVAGFGRLYLPWATSLDSIDGGYVGRKVKDGITAGIFAGSSPDPTSWSYDPNRRLGGAFVNFEGGTFDNLRYTSTSGVGINMLKWNVDRPFVFFENGIFYKRYLSIYHSLQADNPSGNAAVASPGAGISRSFLTVRVQPVPRVEFDLNHTYFRDIPTFDPQLIGTGLLDKYLFQGFSGGARVQVVGDVWTYITLGRSSRSGDAQASWNQLYGVTVGRMPWIGLRTDVHYSKFNSSFGSGSYQSISFSRNFHETLRWELLGGRQSFASPASGYASHFVTGSFEAALGPHYFVQTGYTWNRGGSQNYDQWLFTFGYRFDSRSNRK